VLVDSSAPCFSGTIESPQIRRHRINKYIAKYLADDIIDIDIADRSVARR